MGGKLRQAKQQGKKQCTMTEQTKVYDPFEISNAQLQELLQRFGLPSPLKGQTELQRYHYERGDEPTDEVRLILRADLEDGGCYVVRLLRETEFSAEVVEAQSVFSEALRACGVETPRSYQAQGRYTLPWTAPDGRVITVTVQDFVHGEIQLVDEALVERIGRLHGHCHNLAEKNDLHIPLGTLFGCVEGNELFDIHLPEQLLSLVSEADKPRLARLTQALQRHLDTLAPLANAPRYAVQGDMSENNLYLTCDNRLGLFDYNHAGDACLLVDAVVQAHFLSRLMDYPHPLTPAEEHAYARAFMRGYTAERPLSPAEKPMALAIYTVCDACRYDRLKPDEEGGVEAALRRMEEALSYAETVRESGTGL